MLLLELWLALGSMGWRATDSGVRGRTIGDKLSPHSHPTPDAMHCGNLTVAILQYGNYRPRTLRICTFRVQPNLFWPEGLYSITYQYADWVKPLGQIKETKISLPEPQSSARNRVGMPTDRCDPRALPDFLCLTAPANPSRRITLHWPPTPGMWKE